MPLLILSASEVDRITASFSPGYLRLLMAHVFALLSRTTTVSRLEQLSTEHAVQIPHRTLISTPNYTALFMPARISPASIAGLDTSGSDVLSAGTTVKVVCVPKRPDTRGLPATTLVLDEATGSIKAVVNARKLTALRNAAGSLLSTSLVQSRYPRQIVVFGAGRQVEAHLDLYIRFFPKVEKCTIVNRSLNERARTLHQILTARFAGVEFILISPKDGGLSSKFERNETLSLAIESNEVEDAVRSTDLIICATSSEVPLFPSHWVRSGTHVVLIGSYTPKMHEVDSKLIIRAVHPSPPAGDQSSGTEKPSQILLVDSKSACLSEAGELIAAGIEQEQMTEIGRLVPTDTSGEVDLDGLKRILDSATTERSDSGRGMDKEDSDFEGPLTIFKSVGVGLQDVAIACAVVHKAEAVAAGVTISDYDDETL